MKYLIACLVLMMACSPAPAVRAAEEAQAVSQYRTLEVICALTPDKIVTDTVKNVSNVRYFENSMGVYTNGTWNRIDREYPKNCVTKEIK